MLPGMIVGPGMASAARFSVENLGSGANNSNLSVYTFAAFPLGAPSAARKIVIGIGAGDTSQVVTAVSIGGVSATMIPNTKGSNQTAKTSMWVADVPSGTAGDVVVTWSGTAANCGVYGWAVYASTTMLGDGGGTNSQTVACPENSILLCISGHQNDTTMVWSGGPVKLWQDTAISSASATAARQDIASATSITATVTSSGAAVIAAVVFS
jgi:hypothetical protein